MTDESLLLTTSDNYCVVLNFKCKNAVERQRKILQYKQFCERISYDDFLKRYNTFVSQQNQTINTLEKEIFSQVDADNTEFLKGEISHIDLRKQPQNYINELNQNNYDSSVLKKNTIHFDYRITDAEIHPLIKNLGYKIMAEDKRCQVYFDAKKQEYCVKDLTRTKASVNNTEKKICFVRRNFSFCPNDYKIIQRLRANWQNEKRKKPSLDTEAFIKTIQNKKERSLFKIYAHGEELASSRMLTMKHEFKHMKNEVLFSGLSLKKSAKRLSIEDYYRLEVEDERSAYLSQIIHAANAYMKNGDLDDFSMFDGESQEIVAALKKLPKNNRLSYLQDPYVLMKSSFKIFEIAHRQNYDKGQFKDNMNFKMQKVPVSAEFDADRKFFLLNRSLLYHYKIYNPQTKTFEEKNLASLIRPEDEVKISDENKREIIEPCKQKLLDRIKNYNQDVMRGKINPQLVDEAKKMMRDNLHNPRFINKINDFEITSLYDNEKASPKPTNQPIPAENLTEKSVGWSKDLKRYWSQFDGYKEIENNTKEYKFSLKNSTIRYTEQNKVQISANADYDVYVKLLQEPINKNKPIIFKDTLTKEQALKLYVACVNNNRIMKGAVPKDLSGLKMLKGVPQADLQKCQMSVDENSQRNDIVLQKVIQNRARA